MEIVFKTKCLWLTSMLLSESDSSICLLTFLLTQFDHC